MRGLRSRFSLPLRFFAFGFVAFMPLRSFLLPSGGQRGAKLPLQGVFGTGHPWDARSDKHTPCPTSISALSQCIEYPNLSASLPHLTQHPGDEDRKLSRQVSRPLRQKLPISWYPASDRKRLV